jgi:hypothetical protein
MRGDGLAASEMRRRMGMRVDLIKKEIRERKVK